MNFCSSNLAKSRDKVKPLYLHYESVCGYQTWQECNLPSWAPAYKITSPFKSLNDYISTTTVLKATKLGRMVIYLDKLPVIKSHNSLISWSSEIT